MYDKIRKSNKLTEELNLYDKQNITSEKQSQQQVFDIVNKLSLSHRRVFNVIILLSNKYKCIYIRQDTIGKYIKLCRQRINEILQDLKSLFLVDMWYRHMKSCVYSINTLFNNFTLRRKLCQLLPALGLFCIAWLYAPNHDTTQLVLDNNNYISLFTDTKRRDADIVEQREIKRKGELKNERLHINVSKLFDKVENKYQKREIQRLKTWRIMKYDDQSQPVYEDKSSQKYSEAYKPYVHQPEAQEAPEEFIANISKHFTDEQFKNMINICGKENVMLYLKRVVENKTR